MANDGGGSVMGGAIWMIVISILLFWLPGVGGFIGGLVGGKVSGGVGSALLAWLLSSILIGILFAVLGTFLSGMILIGAMAGLGGLMLGFLDAGTRLLGAIIGGFLA
ncbi:MAG: hypothetical protein ACT4PZ_21245 [Panacagrimonas sp.]